jgi:hypothetical protein
MTYQSRPLLHLGPNICARRGTARLLIVTSTVHSTACVFETVGGLGGAVPAPPIVKSSGAALAPPIILNQPERRSLPREPNGRP